MVLNPFISVLLPAFNAEKFLKESIDSILCQTYSNFELIIINDGSIDNTQAIIDAYDDSRIKCITNSQNKGLIDSLNEGILSCTGIYIIRMDADDIAFKHRIQTQVEFLQLNPHVAMVGAHAIFFNENITSPIENWPLDQSTNTINEIKSAIVWENCIIHPSVCMRTDIAKSLLYDASQKNYEDYDLWLRLLANNHIIAKINEPLLYYRVQENSVTQSTIRKSNFFFYKAKVKFLFINKCISKGKLNLFIVQVSFTLLIDLIMGIAKSVKQIFR